MPLNETSLVKIFCLRHCVSDSGPQFVSSLFADFCPSWRILHVNSIPGYQNEKAEAAFKSAKNILIRTALQHQNEYLALLELRNTSRQDVVKAQLRSGLAE